MGVILGIIILWDLFEFLFWLHSYVYKRFPGSQCKALIYNAIILGLSFSGLLISILFHKLFYK